MENRRILVIEDDPDILEILEYNLANEGFEVVCATDGERGLREAASNKPALVLLDLMLPGIPGLEVCRRLRSEPDLRNVPIIIVTAKGEEADAVAGLEVGADDYVTKPFRIRELMARVNAVLRRTAEPPPLDESRLVCGGIVVDLLRHEVSVDDEQVELTLAEFRLLAALAQQPGRVFPGASLVRQITAGGYQISERNVDVHIAALRRKLGGHGTTITSVRGIGYKFKEDDGA
ncbi:MAG: response regulator transcription factor [Acidobacteria bacterium]|nr:response regulator transcription factor [Acidobacteriota bacterium]